MPWPFESKQLSGFLWLARLLPKVSNWLLTPHREHRHHGGNILQGTYLSSLIYWTCMNWNVSVHVIFQTGDQHVPSVVLAQLVFRMLLYIHLDRCHYFLFMVDQEDHYWFLLFGASVSCSIQQGRGDSCSPTFCQAGPSSSSSCLCTWLAQGQPGTAICARGLEIHPVF